MIALTFPDGARSGHFDVTHVPAMIERRSPRGTTKPVPSRACRTCARSKANATVADEAYGISSHHRAMAGSTGRNGSAILAALEAAGAKPRAMVRDRDVAVQKYGANHDWVIGDVTQPATLDAALKGIDVVISAAAGEIAIARGQTEEQVKTEIEAIFLAN